MKPKKATDLISIPERISELLQTIGSESETDDHDLCDVLAHELATLSILFAFRRNAVRQRLVGMMGDAKRNENGIERLYSELRSEIRW